MGREAQKQVLTKTLGRTVVIVVAAAAMTGFFLVLLGREGAVPVGVGLAALVSLVIASVSTYRTFRLVRQLEETRRDLEQLSTHDYLTGIYNRRFMVEQATAILTLSQRHGFPVSLIMMDLDHFKQVNDTYGHGAGDTVLVEMVAVIRGMIRATDVFGRYGGEEFIVFMPHTDNEDATNMAERIREEVKAHKYGGISITLSMGVVTATPTMNQLDDLIDRADVALYEAKDGGRDRVEVSQQV